MEDVTSEYRRDRIRSENPTGSKILNWILNKLYANQYFFDFNSIKDISDNLPNLHFNMRKWGKPIIVWGICDFSVQKRIDENNLYFFDYTGEIKIFGMNKNTEKLLMNYNRFAQFHFFDNYCSSYFEFVMYENRRLGTLPIIYAVPEKGKGRVRRKKLDKPDFFPDDPIINGIELIVEAQLEEMLV